MKQSMKRWAITSVIALAGACAPGTNVEEAVVAVVTTTIPTDGECTHIRMVRSSDFQVTEYVGPLASASLRANVGEHQVTATAFPAPCSAEPAESPWMADAQIITFIRGTNSLSLKFRPNTRVVVDAEFDDQLPGELSAISGSTVRIGRNNEDLAGPDYAIDGWEVKQLALPPNVPSESVLFSMEGALPSAPRGLARTFDGRFLAQGTDPSSVAVFSAGAFQASLPVSYATVDMPHAQYVDGLDEGPVFGQLVRTAFSNNPVTCPVDTAGCYAWLEILDLQSSGGVESLVVSQQLFLPDGGVALHTTYPLGVTYSGGKYFVSSNVVANETYLFAMNVDGSLAVGPVTVNTSIEGVIVDASNRLITMDYAGHLRVFSTSDLTEDPALAMDYTTGVNVSNPGMAAWRGATNQLIVYNGERMVSASADFASVSDIPIDLSGFNLLAGYDYVPSMDALALIDRVPPIDAATSTRIPKVVYFDLNTNAEVGSVLLSPGVTGNLRPRSLAVITGTGQFASNYRRPGPVADPLVDTVVFIHDSDGTFSHSFDLAPYGFTLVSSVNPAPASNELIVRAVDSMGVSRLVVTDLNGLPLGSYRHDLAPALGDLTVIRSGAFAGQVALFNREPSQYLRAWMP